MDERSLQIRSYRVCFDLERRLHKIDTWRIPLPYGLPLRGLAYAAAALGAVLLLNGVPLLGDVLGVLHPALRFAVLPAAIAVVLTRVLVDGRSAHRAGLAWLRLAVQPKRVAAFREAPTIGPVRLGEVAMAPDERGSRLRRGVVAGRGIVLLRYPVRAAPRGRTLVVRQQTGGPQWRGKQVRLHGRQRMAVG